MTIFDRFLQVNPDWGPNPMLGEGFTFNKLDAEHLAVAVEVGRGLPFSLFPTFDEGHGSDAAYSLSGRMENGHEIAMVFSNTTMTEQPTADRFLQFAVAPEKAAVFVCAQRFSRDFLLDLEARIRPPLFPMKAVADTPWFVKTDRYEWGGPVDDTCQGCLRLHTEHKNPCEPQAIALWQEYRDEKWPRYTHKQDYGFNQDLREYLDKITKEMGK